MKKSLIVCLAAALAISTLAGCSGGSSSSAPSQSDAPSQSGAASESSAASQESGSNFDTARMINVVSREDGSGTRGAFIELFGIQEKGADGKKTDKTTVEAIIASKTDVMLTNVAGDEYAIGYVSLGSLNDNVKALSIDGNEAKAENVKSGAYKIARPFNVATKGEPTGLAKDFLDFIMSAEGQQVVEGGGYIKINDAAAAFAGTKPEGKIVVAGSSSVSPIMEKLSEAYRAINPGATIEVQQSDSTAGMTGAVDGTCDIGMASRELSEDEAGQLTALAIANDGIAVIVAPANPTAGLTSEQVKNIFTGAVTTWEEAAK